MRAVSISLMKGGFQVSTTISWNHRMTGLTLIQEHGRRVLTKDISWTRVYIFWTRTWSWSNSTTLLMTITKNLF